jgi:hypothetical protein
MLTRPAVLVLLVLLVVHHLKMQAPPMRALAVAPEVAPVVGVRFGHLMELVHTAVAGLVECILAGQKYTQVPQAETGISALNTALRELR